MAVAIELLGPAKDGRGEWVAESAVEKFIEEQIALRRFGLLFGLNREQGIVIDEYGAHALPPDKMQEVGLKVMKLNGLVEKSGQTVEDYTDLEKGEKKHEVTTFEAGEINFEKRVCINSKDISFRVSWFLRDPRAGRTQ